MPVPSRAGTCPPAAPSSVRCMPPSTSPRCSPSAAPSCSSLIVTNAALTFVLALAAWLVVRRMMRPVQVLASHLETGMQRQVEPIPDAFLDKAPVEFRRLFEAFNRMAEAIRERETLSRQLVEEERLASLGRLASGMAHEINNPLGGLFNAIDTLKAAWGARRCPPTHDRPDRARAEGHPRRGPHHARDLPGRSRRAFAQARRRRRPQAAGRAGGPTQAADASDGSTRDTTSCPLRPRSSGRCCSICSSTPAGRRRREARLRSRPMSKVRASSPPSRTWARPSRAAHGTR